MSLATTVRSTAAKQVHKYGKSVTLYQKDSSQYDIATGGVPADETPYTFKAVVGPVSYSAMSQDDRANPDTLTQENYRSLTIIASDLPAGVRPTSGDRMTLTGETGDWFVRGSTPIEAQGVLICFSVTVSR